jgi:hypothetical protein
MLSEAKHLAGLQMRQMFRCAQHDRVVLLALALLTLCGCCPKAQEKPPYTGPTDSMAQVAADINANNQKIPTLWSSLYYKANIVDEKKHGHFVNGEGVLLYRQPNDFRLIGRKEIGTIFDIGANREAYWLRVVPEVSTMWYGRYEDLASADLNELHIPIRPDLVLGVLTFTVINTNFSELPAPTMRFNNEDDSYMLVWITKLPDRWIGYREVWYDRATKRPKFVKLYDANGRIAIRADLAQFKRVPIEGQPQANWPEIPADYKLSFPDSGSTMEFTLSDDTTLHKGVAPNDKSFAMPDPQTADVDRAVKIGGR